MKKLLVLLFVLVCALQLAAKVDLNTADLDELLLLPITQKQAQDILEYREHVAIFGSIYDLRKIPSIDQKTLLKIKDLAVVSLYIEEDDVAARREEIRDLMERLDSNEGGSEGMSDVWEDYLMTPHNVNKMHFDDLISLPNVSGVDAVGILRRVAQGDTIADTRDLRNTVGLSYYGYTNLRSYVYYKEPPVKNRLMWDAQMQYYTRYLDEGSVDMYLEPFLLDNYGTNMSVNHRKDLTYWGYFDLDRIDPDILIKLRARYGNRYKIGWMHYSPKGEANLEQKDMDEIIADSKFYAGYENNEMPLLNNTKLKAYLGHYRVTYGEGLVMENSDFYSARKTGYGFSKRILGITPDLSRTQEYALRGGALEIANPYFHVSGWLSQDNKDAVVYLRPDGSYALTDKYQNDILIDEEGKHYYLDDIDNDGENDQIYTYEDGTPVQGKRKVFSYVVPTIRFDNNELRQAEAYFNSELQSGTPYDNSYINLGYRKDALKERLVGTHLQVNPFIGTKLGFTTYTAFYDDAYFAVPDWNGLKYVLLRDYSYYGESDYKMMNSEVAGLYSTLTDSYARNFRRVIGFDAQTVLGNTSIQGEYAELTVDGKDTVLTDDPKAYLISAYTQWSNLYFLTLYRNYDIGFDNPYSNAFSEHERFKDTILKPDNAYLLTNPTLVDLYNNSTQAQPERGLYFETRYKFNRYFTIGRSYLDLFERLADGRRTARFQSELEFRPLYQLALRLRYKNQVNRYDDAADRGVSKTNEYTLAVRTFLSNRDFLEFEYRYNTVLSPPYTSLTNPAEPGNNSMAGAMALMTGDYIGVNYTHNFNSNFKIQGAFLYWFGHGISHWDWEDMEIDFMGEKGAKAWIALHSRVSRNMYLSLKYRHKAYEAKELSIRRYNVPVQAENYYQRVENKENTIRLSLEYRY